MILSIQLVVLKYVPQEFLRPHQSIPWKVLSLSSLEIELSWKVFCISTLSFDGLFNMSPFCLCLPLIWTYDGQGTLFFLYHPFENKKKFLVDNYKNV